MGPRRLSILIEHSGSQVHPCGVEHRAHRLIHSKESHGITEFSAINGAKQKSGRCPLPYRIYSDNFMRFMYIKSLGVPTACYKLRLSQMAKHLATDELKTFLGIILFHFCISQLQICLLLFLELLIHFGLYPSHTRSSIFAFNVESSPSFSGIYLLSYRFIFSRINLVSH